MRLTQRWQKAIYIAGYLLLGGAVSKIVVALGNAAGSPLQSVLTFTISSVGLYFATRIFRTNGEDVAAPRPLWRMTGRPKAGFILTGYFGLGLFLVIIELALAPQWAPAGWSALTTSIQAVIFAELYLYSSIRLLRESRAAARLQPAAELGPYSPPTT